MGLWRYVGVCTASAVLLACAVHSPRPPQWFLEPEWSPEVLRFGGYAFRARSSENLTGAGPNRWSSRPENVRVEANGDLRLAITEHDGRWYSAEVSTALPDAYCRVRFTLVSEPALLNPAVIAAVFVYRNDQSELDVELGRWGRPEEKNAQFVVAPPTADRMARFELPKAVAPVVFTVDWRADAVIFNARTQNGEQHAFRYEGEPRPERGGHRLHLSLWLREQSPTGPHGLELTLRDLQIEALPD